MSWKDLLTIAALLVGLLGGMKLLIADPIERRLDRMEGRLIERIDRIDRSQQDLQRRVTAIEKNAKP